MKWILVFMLIAALFELIYAIPFPDWINENAISIGQFSVKWYGLAYVVGWGLAFLYVRRLCTRKDIWIPTGVPRGAAIIPNKRMIEDYAFFILLGVMLGGRIGSIILYNPGQYLDDPLSMLKIWEGGMSFHGGFLGVCVAGLYMAKSRKIEVFRLADLAAISVPFALFLGRVANFVNQELYGRVTDVPWAFIFNKDQTSLPRHPSQLYEAALEGALMFIILRIATHKFKALTRPGICWGLFVMLYGLFRIFVEFFREPDNIPQFGDVLTRGMAYSLPMVIGGAIVVFWAMRRPPVTPKRVADTPKAET